MLSLEQKEALIGIMLGDGHLIRVKPTHNTRLQIDQAYPEKEQYVTSLYKLLEPLVTMSPTLLTRKDKRNGSVTQSIYFRTLSMPCLNYYHDLFYKDKVKIVPRNLEELLTARGLANWIMVFTIFYLIICLSSILPYEGVEGGLLVFNGLFPVKLYSNADKEKESIYEDNRNKCGVYR